MILQLYDSPREGSGNEPERPHLECSTRLAADPQETEAVVCLLLLLLLSQTEALQSHLAIKKGHLGQSGHHTCYLLDS